MTTATLEAAPVKTQIEIDRDRYISVAAEVERICTEKPYLRRALVALKVGARAFGIDPADLVSLGKVEAHIVNTRQKLIALTYYCLTSRNWTEVSFVFNRSKNTCRYAETVYGGEIRRALDGRR